MKRYGDLQNANALYRAGAYREALDRYLEVSGKPRPGVFVGRYCSIGRRVSWGAGMHSMTGISTAPILRGGGKVYTGEQQIRAGIVPRRPTQGPNALTISENDVWVGDGAIILPGVRIGTGAVIGANAVVTGDVEPYAIVAGVSAKPLRQRFAPFVVDQLFETRWWDYPLLTIKSLPCSNVLEFVNAFKAGHLAPEICKTLEFGTSDRQ